MNAYRFSTFLFVVTMIFSGCSGKGGGSTSAAASSSAAAKSEGVDSQGKPATVGPTAPVAPVPVKPAGGDKPGVSVQALDTASYLECDQSGEYQHWSLDRYELQRFDESAALENSGDVAAIALARLKHFEPVLADRLQADLEKIPNISDGDIGDAHPPSLGVWLPKGCTLKHVGLVSAGKIWLDQAKLRELSETDRAMALLHLAISRRQIERGDNLFLAARRFNRLLFRAKSYEPRDLIAASVLMSPGKPYEHGYKNGDVAFLSSDDKEDPVGDLVYYLGNRKSVLACAVKLAAQSAPIGSCDAARSAAKLRVDSRYDEEVVRVADHNGVVFLRDPSRFGLPANTADYEFSSVSAPREEEHFLDRNESVKFKLKDTLQLKTIGLTFNCKAGDFITMKIGADSADSFQAHVDGTHFAKCTFEGNTESRVAGLDLFLPMDQRDLSSSDPADEVLVGQLRADAEPVAFTLYGHTFTLKAGQWIGFTADGRLDLFYNDQVMPLTLNGSTCNATYGRVFIDLDDAWMDGSYKTPCTFHPSGMQLTVKEGDFRASLKRGRLVSLSTLAWNYSARGLLTFGKSRAQVTSVRFRDDGSIQRLGVASDEGAEFDGHFYYYNSEDKKTEDAYHDMRPFDFCYNPADARFESADLDPKWCNQ